MKTVARVIPAVRTEEGEGFVVHRPFPVRALSHVDPFLLLDEMGPMELGPGEAKGAPDHPHRGFETVTSLLAGEFEHRDSKGGHGVLRPGDVQWMTAGRGVIHSEMPTDEFQRKGGRLHGFQVWVNLPAKDKMTEPRYQDLRGNGIPVFRSADGKVSARVVAGRVGDVEAPTRTHTPIQYAHFRVEPGGRHVQACPEGYTALVYVISGRGWFGGEPRPGSGAERGNPRHLLIFAQEGGDAAFENDGDEELSFLWLAGRPIGEPVARYGPFVMNRPEELDQAFRDYREGRFA